MKKNKSVLIVGSGGREHALGWRFSQAPQVEKVFFAPGNGGTSELGENIDINVEDIESLSDFAKKKGVNLTFVGPEVPLTLGIVDAFERKGLKIFGPNKSAAQLEGSKAFACKFMDRHAIPYPASETFTSENKAKEYIKKLGHEHCVIKASGLAAGKGVILPSSKEEADKAVDDILNKKIFGEAGSELVIQEKLSGPEVSILAFTDGDTVVPLVPSQDHKRVNDHDQGPNTGGMGAYAPAPFVSRAQMEMIQRDILEKTIEGLKSEGIVYRGILYAGLMMTPSGPKVLEYNVRFGDPETQPLMMLLESDLYELSTACIEGRLTASMVQIREGAAVCVVLSAKGYPGSYGKGKIIDGLSSVADRNVQIFHAGTKATNKGIVTSGGRVLGVTAFDTSLKNACAKTYAAIGKGAVTFEGMHYRRDIAYQALEKYK